MERLLQSLSTDRIGRKAEGQRITSAPARPPSRRRRVGQPLRTHPRLGALIGALDKPIEIGSVP